MPVFQFQCGECQSIFEALVSSSVRGEPACVSCDSRFVERVSYTYFAPNKTFCPKEGVVELERVKGSLGSALADFRQKCPGCRKKTL